jgi:hypothetical protein
MYPTVFDNASGVPTNVSPTNPLPSTAVLEAGELHVGNVGGEGDLIDCTLTLDTAIYADGDVLAETQVLSTTAMRKNDGTGILHSILVLDEDDQGVGMDLLFFNANVSLGAENAAPAITDANMRNYLGKVAVNASDFTDWGGVRTATIPPSRCGQFFKSGAGVRTIWVAAVTRGGTPTYSAGGIKLRVGILWN